MMLRASDFLIFKLSPLQSHHIEVQIGIDAITTLISNQESSWNQMHEDLQNFISNKENDTRFSCDEERNDFYDNVLQGEGQTFYELKRLQRYSSFMAIYSRFEYVLKSICYTVENVIQISTNFKKNVHFHDCWNYLIRHVKIDSKQHKLEELYNDWDNYRLIRNVLAHNGGEPSETKHHKALEFLSFTKDLSNCIIVTPKKLSQLLDCKAKFFEQLLTAIDERCSDLRSISP